MDSIGSLVASEIKINREIKNYPLCPNVITIHPTINLFNNNNTHNIIAIVDLSLQKFLPSKSLNSYSSWWLSFDKYFIEINKLLLKYVFNNNKNEWLSIKHILYQYLSGSNTKLTSNHHITELFINDYYNTDTLIAINTPKPAPTFNFLSFSDDNPYANLSKKTDKLHISQSNGDKKDDDLSCFIELIRIDSDSDSAQLYKWFSYSFPSLEFPLTTSRERDDTQCNDMLKHWESHLSENNRFLLIYPEKLGEISDIYFNENIGKIYWIQSLYGDNINDLNQKYKLDLRQIYTLNVCHISNNFKCECIKLLITNEYPSRFKIIKQNNNLLIWNFSKDGALYDIFTAVINDKNNTNYNSTNKKLNNRLCRVQNAQNFNKYRFKDGQLQDLIRDIPKICSLNGKSVIFGGACFLSILRDINKIYVYDKDDENGMQLISSSLPNIFSYDSWIPVKILKNADNTEWITDYIPFNNNSILARWQSKYGKSVYCIWKQIDNNGDNWKCIITKDYDDNIWNDSIMSCYHFGDRLKTILLSIQLTQTKKKNDINNLNGLKK